MGFLSRELFRDSDRKYSQEKFIHWNNQFQHEIFLAKEKTYFSKLKKRILYAWF